MSSKKYVQLTIGGRVKEGRTTLFKRLDAAFQTQVSQSVEQSILKSQLIQQNKNNLGDSIKAAQT